MEELSFTNTLTRTKELFKPLQPGKASIYTCGPTVYNFAHIGNMRAYIFADILRRILDFAGYQTQHVMNITDVGHLVSDGDEGEDKMELGKQREGVDAWAIAQKYTDAFFNHCQKLNIKKPHIVCKATDHIQEQIDMIKILNDKNIAYRTTDGMYFDTSQFPAYGEMAKLDIEGLQSGIRIDNSGKKNKTDFALWKFSPEDSKRDMEWESPWGKGFPGWHIECSAMSMKYLGDQFDIHTGGIDHIPVHHTNEIAQSEACTGHDPFVQYWLHTEFLNLDGDIKMSKSKGHILTIDTLVEKGYSPLIYRYYLLTGHYRKPLHFSYKTMDQTKIAYDRLIKHIANLKETHKPADFSTFSKAAKNHQDTYKKALFDDLNTPRALAELHQILKDEQLTGSEKLALVFELDLILDVGLTAAENVKVDIPENVLDLVQAREQARLDKNWAEADQLRAKIDAQGYNVKDGAQGPEIQKV